MISSTSSSKARAWTVKAALWGALFVLANLLAREPIGRLVETPVRLQQEVIARSKAPIVVLGDSHALALGDSDDQVLNLADGGDSLADMRARLHYLLRQGHPVRHIVINLAWHSLSKGRAIRNNRQQGELFTDTAGYQKIYGDPGWRHALRLHLFTRLPLLNPVNARLSRRYLVHRFFPEPDEQPWPQLSPRERIEIAEKRWLRNYGLPYDPEQLAQLDGLLGDCREAGIEPLLIQLPVAPEYDVLVARSDERVAGLQALKARGLSLWDWSSRPTRPEDFVNQDHLARRGPLARQIRAQLLERLR